MPEWIIERGIGETRAALIEDRQILEARIIREGIVTAGTILDARLKSVGRNAIALADGHEYLLPKGSGRATEGAAVQIEVTREWLGGDEPWKRALARISEEAPSAAPELDGREIVHSAPTDELAAAGWFDLLDETRSGIIGFRSGELRVSPTPAMTLIDVDGGLPLAELAMAGAKAAAAAIRRHGIAGSIGIDLPSVQGKAARTAVAEAVDAILPQPFERTAVNGFGFLQIVRPRRQASMFDLVADRASFEARALLRHVGRQTGAFALHAHPSVIAVLESRPDWIGRLERQVGGAVALRADAGLAISAGYAKAA